MCEAHALPQPGALDVVSGERAAVLTSMCMC